MVGMHATVLIDLLWFNVVHHSSLFQYFFSTYYVPSWFLVCNCLLTFLETVIMHDWWTHAYCIKTMVPLAPVISIIVWEEDASLLAMFNPLHSSTNQQLNFCNQSSHYEIYGWFSLWMEVIMCLPQNWDFLWWLYE